MCTRGVLSGGQRVWSGDPCGVLVCLRSGALAGRNAGVTHVPIVPGAILFDLGIGSARVRPTREMGEKAALAANAGPVAEGNVGAGTGATVGKILGMKTAMKSGLGTASLILGNGTVVAAMVAVNALGDVIDPQTGRIIAGARVSAASREFANSAAVMRHGVNPAAGGHTVIGIVATNARLDRVETNKLAALGSLGVARTISPVNTMADGDITFAISPWSKETAICR